MTLRHDVAAAVLVVMTIAPYAAAQKTDAELRNEQELLRKELSEAELALRNTRSSYLLECSDDSLRTGFEHFIQTQAKNLDMKALDLNRVEGSEPVPFIDGRPSLLQLRRLAMHGQGSFYDVQLLLHRIALMRDTRALDFETLNVKVETGGTVSFAAGIVDVCWADDPQTKLTNAPHPALPTGLTPGELEVTTDRARLQKVRSANEAWRKFGARFQPMRLIDALAALDEDWGDPAVLLTELRFTAPVLTLRGATGNASARAVVDESLHKAAFDEARIDWSPAGDCRAFTATVRLKEGKAEAKLPATKEPANEIFDERLPSLCSSKARSAATAVTAHGSGTLTLHLRDVDVVDVFGVLNDLQPAAGFVVEPAVTARVNVDIEGATLDETFAALRAAGVAFVGPGPLHRVCNADCGTPTSPKQEKSYDGTPINLTVKDAEITDLLHTFEVMLGPFEIYAPQDLHATISLFVHDMPWDRVFDGIVSSVRLTYVIENRHVYVGREPDVRKAGHPGTIRAASGSAPGRRRWWSRLDAATFGVDDVRLAALVRTNGPWKAYVHVPGSPTSLLALDAGAVLFDGRVESVERNGVTLRTTAGREVVLSLSPSVP